MVQTPFCKQAAMAAHSNRSASPLSSRPISVNPKILGTSATPRTSFGGNKPSVFTNPRPFDPFSPSKAPSDFAGIGKDCEEKENGEKDHSFKASKFHSPAAKGCKKFMAPTISAASKFTPSPRKKVLVERNDPVRTSISFSDRKPDISSIYSCVSEDLEHKSKRSINFSSNSSSKSGITESGGLKLDSGIPNKVFGPSDLLPIAPLDADPSMPLCDPKTDYSSQFLHCKLNPRIEILLNREKEVDSDEFKWLEDNIMLDILSENFSECTVEPYTEEIAASGDTEMGAEHDETRYSNEQVSEPSEALTMSKSTGNSIHEKNLVQERDKKPWSLSTVLWCFLGVLMLLIACGLICAAYSPGFNHLAMKDLSLSDLNNFYHQCKVAAPVKVTFRSLARHVSHFSVNSAFFKSNLQKGDKLGPLSFVNLSNLQIYTLNEGHFLINGGIKKFEEDLAENELEEVYKEDEFDENFEEEFNTKGDDDVAETEVMVCADSVKNVQLVKDNQESELAEIGEGISDESGIERSGGDGDIDDLSSSASAAVHDIVSTLDGESSSQDDSVIEIVERRPAMEESTRSEAKFVGHYGIGVSALFAAALAALAVYAYRYKTRNHPFNWQKRKADNGVCPSEMSSSCQNRNATRGGGSTQVQSIETMKKTRNHCERESLASSSSSGHASEQSPSPSYGSFISIQRIPIKNGPSGEEEVVSTPVRRSSRIRYHHQ